MTDAEHRLWFRLRRKQLLGLQFYRQKPIGKYIVDFYAPAVALVIEVDGGQHFEEHLRQGGMSGARLTWKRRACGCCGLPTGKGRIVRKAVMT